MSPPIDAGRHMADGVQNPFDEGKPRPISEYTAQQVATMQSRLNQRLGPEFISTRPGAGGGKLCYVAADKIINLANEVFGFNGWSSSIQNVQIDFVDEAPSGRVALGLSIIVRVTLKDGTFHEDIGYGQIENCKGKSAAFEKAKKEAATDALKRALRTFGNVLGNCIYDKSYVAKVASMKVEPQAWDMNKLHRHPEYRQSKPGGAGDAVASPAKYSGAAAPGPPGLRHMPSNGTEFEDEFGANLFDEVDFGESNVEGVTIGGKSSNEQGDSDRPDVVMKIEGTENLSRQPAHMQPNPTSRTPGFEPPQVHHGSDQTYSRPNSPLKNAPYPNPRTPRQQDSPRPNFPVLVARPPQPNHPPPTNGRGAETSTVGPANAYLRNRVADSRLAGDYAHQQRPASAAAAAPPGGPVPAVGFVTSRVAELLQNRGGADGSTYNHSHSNGHSNGNGTAAMPQPPPAAAAFNPHAQSPSIRRTGLISHNKSAPVSRLAIQSAAAAAAAASASSHPGGPTALTAAAPTPATTTTAAAGMAMTMTTTTAAATTGLTAPAPATVAAAGPAPSATGTTAAHHPDAARKIGMPLSAAGGPSLYAPPPPGRAQASPYRPPALVGTTGTNKRAPPDPLVRRAPLADVSNVVAGDGGGGGSGGGGGMVGVGASAVAVAVVVAEDAAKRVKIGGVAM